MNEILLTGGSGFLGNALLIFLFEKGFSVRVSTRRETVSWPVSVESYVMTGSPESLDWSASLNGVNVVIHCAGKANYDSKAGDQLSELRQINTIATLNLARQAAEKGVERFIFISSAKVNGEKTIEYLSFKENVTSAPDDFYAASKYEAEQGLLKIADQTGMEVVIIRPPLIYGHGVKGNFAALINWVKKSIPIPVGAVKNNRSLVALDNLVDFIALCADREKSPKAANEIFLISDGEDVSTPELIRKIAHAYGKQARLIPVPVSWMRFAAKLLGKQAVADRLFGNLQVDSSKARYLLGWKPVITMDEQLARMAALEKNQASS